MPMYSYSIIYLFDIFLSPFLVPPCICGTGQVLYSYYQQNVLRVNFPFEFQSFYAYILER